MLNLVDLPGGTALEIRLSPATVRGEEGTESFMDFLYAFCELGGYFIQPDIVDAATLREAQKDPETYSNLSVRVTGWSARFRTLSETWQKMIIDRTEAGY
jgi:formate C-acetyltransferase